MIKKVMNACLLLAVLLSGGVAPSGMMQAVSAQEIPPCISPRFEEDGKCVTLPSTDVVVTGQRLLGFTENFNLNLFQSQVQAVYYPNDPDFRLLPSTLSAYPSRNAELVRRRRIHNCIANQLAAGFRQLGTWTVQEVKFELSDGRYAMFDIVYGTIPGVPQGVVEVKTILDYEADAAQLFKRNQQAVAEAVVMGQAVPQGPNAAKSGFLVGQPLGRGLPVAIVPVPIPRACYVP